MEFKHPKYYAELERIRKQCFKDQASSDKPQASDKLVTPRSDQLEASSDKPQASSSKRK